MSILTWWRELIIGILALIIVAGVIMWPKPQAPVTTTKTQIVERVISPDGTITERVVTRDVVAATPAALKKYHVSASVNPMNPKQDQRVGAAARLGNLPLFLEVGFRPVERAADIGISFEF